MLEIHGIGACGAARLPYVARLVLYPSVPQQSASMYGMACVRPRYPCLACCMLATGALCRCCRRHRASHAHHFRCALSRALPTRHPLLPQAIRISQASELAARATCDTRLQFELHVPVAACDEPWLSGVQYLPPGAAAGPTDPRVATSTLNSMSADASARGLRVSVHVQDALNQELSSENLAWFVVCTPATAAQDSAAPANPLEGLPADHIALQAMPIARAKRASRTIDARGAGQHLASQASSTSAGTAGDQPEPCTPSATSDLGDADMSARVQAFRRVLQCMRPGPLREHTSLTISESEEFQLELQADASKLGLDGVWQPDLVQLQLALLAATGMRVQVGLGAPVVASVNPARAAQLLAQAQPGELVKLRLVLPAHMVLEQPGAGPRHSSIAHAVDVASQDADEAPLALGAGSSAEQAESAADSAAEPGQTRAAELALPPSMFALRCLLAQRYPPGLLRDCQRIPLNWQAAHDIDPFAKRAARERSLQAVRGRSGGHSQLHHACLAHASEALQLAAKAVQHLQAATPQATDPVGARLGALLATRGQLEQPAQQRDAASQADAVLMLNSALKAATHAHMACPVSDRLALALSGLARASIEALPWVAAPGAALADALDALALCPHPWVVVHGSALAGISAMQLGWHELGDGLLRHALAQAPLVGPSLASLPPEMPATQGWLWKTTSATLRYVCEALPAGRTGQPKVLHAVLPDCALARLDHARSSGPPEPNCAAARIHDIYFHACGVASGSSLCLLGGMRGDIAQPQAAAISDAGSATSSSPAWAAVDLSSLADGPRTPRVCAAAGQTAGKLWIIGGWGSSPSTDSVVSAEQGRAPGPCGGTLCFSTAKLQWQHVSPGGERPTGRAAAAAASIGPYVLLQGGVHGGAAASGEVLSGAHPDMWVMNSVHSSGQPHWQRANGVGVAPPVRFGHCMSVWDPARLLRSSAFQAVLHASAADGLGLASAVQRAQAAAQAAGEQAQLPAGALVAREAMAAAQRWLAGESAGVPFPGAALPGIELPAWVSAPNASVPAERDGACDEDCWSSVQLGWRALHAVRPGSAEAAALASNLQRSAGPFIVSCGGSMSIAAPTMPACGMLWLFDVATSVWLPWRAPWGDARACGSVFGSAAVVDDMLVWLEGGGADAAAVAWPAISEEQAGASLWGSAQHLAWAARVLDLDRGAASILHLPVAPHCIRRIGATLAPVRQPACADEAAESTCSAHGVTVAGQFTHLAVVGGAPCAADSSLQLPAQVPGSGLLLLSLASLRAQVEQARPWGADVAQHLVTSSGQALGGMVGTWAAASAPDETAAAADAKRRRRRRAVTRGREPTAEDAIAAQLLTLPDGRGEMPGGAGGWPDSASRSIGPVPDDAVPVTKSALFDSFTASFQEVLAQEQARARAQSAGRHPSVNGSSDMQDMPTDSLASPHGTPQRCRAYTQPAPGLRSRRGPLGTSARC